MIEVKDAVKEYVEKFLGLLVEQAGIDAVSRDVLIDTPSRVGKMMDEILCGYRINPNDYLKTFETKTDEMIISRGIDFYSLCEHHLLPFYGHIHIGYIPSGKVLGLSKLARIAQVFACRLQLQERLTNQIADFLFETETREQGACEIGTELPDSELKLGFKGVMVVIEAVHLCEVMRGVKMAHTRMVTSSVRGGFKENAQTRSEFLSLIHNGDTL
jgi:GTP cyclohydrolase I